MSAIVELVLLAAALVVIVVVGGRILRGGARRRRERSYLDQLRGEDEEESGGSGSEQEDEDEAPRAGVLDRRLRAAGLAIPPALWLVLSLLAGLIFVALVLGVFPGLVLPAVLVGALFAYIPYVILGEWGRRRARRFEVKLVDAVDYMASALESGENAMSALQSAAEASSDPVRRELTAVATRLEAGTEIARALAPMRQAFDSEGTRLFTQSLIVKWRAGGDLVPVLRSVAWVMRERVRTTLRLRSELAGVQWAAVIVAVLPYVLIPFFLASRPQWAAALVDHPSGPPLLLGAIVLQIVGFLMLRRILKIEL